MNFCELIPKLIEDLIAGTILLIIGFEIFKRQEKFKASAQEVKSRCKELEIFLEPYINLNLQLLDFESRIRTSFQSNLTNFVDSFLSNTIMENRIPIILFKNNVLLKFEPSIPVNLAKTVELQEKLYSLVNYSNSLLMSYGILLDVMEKVNEQYPNRDREYIDNVWKGYRSSRLIFSYVLKMLQGIAHKSIHGSYDWDEFIGQLKNIEKIPWEKQN